MSTPPGKPQGASGSSTISTSADSLPEEEEKSKDKKTGKFGLRDTDKPDDSVSRATSSPVSMMPASTRRKRRPSRLTEAEERIWTGHVSGSQDDEQTPSLERSMTMASSGDGSSSLSRSQPSYRSRAQTIAGIPAFQMSDAEATDLLNKLRIRSKDQTEEPTIPRGDGEPATPDEKVLNQIQAGNIIHQECSDDEPATLDELTRLQSLSFEQAPPKIQVTPFEFDTLLALTDLSNPQSALRQAIQEHFGCPLETIPEYELDRIYSHCLEVLNTVDFYDQLSADAAKKNLLSNLQNYRSEVFSRLHACSRCHSGAEKIITVTQLIKHIGLPDTPHLIGLVDIIEQAITMLNKPLYEDITRFGYDSLLAEIQMLSKQLDAAFELLPTNIQSNYTALAEDIAEIQSDLNTLSNQVRLLKKNDFRSKENNQNSINALFLAGLNVLKTATSEAEKQAKSTLEALYIKALEKSDFWPDAIARLLGCEQLILETLKSVGLDGQFHASLVAQLQETSAQTVTKTILLKMGGRDYEGEVRFQPAACLRVDPLPEVIEEFDALHEEVDYTRSFAPFENDYEDKFCPAMNRAETDHCVALTLVDMKIGDETVYEEIRAGVPYAYAIEDQEERKQTTRKRWREVFTATLVQKHSGELRNAMANPETHAPIDLPLFYDCLLSPDMLRSFIQDKVLGSKTLQAVAGKMSRLEKLKTKAQGVNDDELGWCRKMWEDVQNMNRKDLTLDIRDSKGQIHPVRIRPNLFMAITPCNELVFGDGLFTKTKAWPFADFITGEYIKATLGSLDPASPIQGYASSIMSQLDKQSAQYREIKELALMIRTIFQLKLHHILTNDPMFFSNLLAREKFESGMPVRILPGHGRRISREEIFNSCQLTLNSCQTEWQEKSTGIPGYKMKGFMLGFAAIVFDAVNWKVKPKTKWLLQD